MTPPRCIRKVRSETFRTSTSSRARRLSTMRVEWSVSEAAHVRSMRSESAPEPATSRAVTMPPASSTVLVRPLTAEPPDGTSSRMVIE
jgi:hypothetical protein